MRLIEACVIADIPLVKHLDHGIGHRVKSTYFLELGFGGHTDSMDGTSGKLGDNPVRQKIRATIEEAHFRENVF